MSDLVALEPSSLPALVLEEEAASARRYALAEKSEASRRAYRSDFRHFAGWCAERNLSPMPATAETVCAYMAALADAGMKASTIGRRTAAIRHAHRLAGVEPPTNSEAVKTVLRGIRRSIGSARVQKAPATADRVAAMLAEIPDTLIGKRDRALLLLGFSGAFRRSELVALTVADLAEAEGGIRVTVRRSKTDQEGQGQEIAIPHGHKLMPIRALREWLKAAGIEEGPAFRPVAKGGKVGNVALSDRQVAIAIKRYAEAAGFDPAEFSGHSLRSGFLTTGAEAGASVFKLMEVSRHKSVDTLRGYVRRVDLFRDHAGASFL